MIDVVTVGAGGGSIAWLSPEGTLKVGPRLGRRGSRPTLLRKGGTEPTITDAHLVLGRIPPHLLGGEIPLDADAATAGIDALAARLRLDREQCAAGILEISAWNQANALRQVTVKRGLDVRDFPMVTFGGSGSLLACRLMDILGLPAVLVPPNPGNVSAYGLLTVDVRNDYVQTSVAPTRPPSTSIRSAAVYDDLAATARKALHREGFAAGSPGFERTADLRYFGQAFEVRVDCPDGDVDRRWADPVADAFHDAHRALYGYDFRGNAGQQVEWVNLRVTGIGPIPRPRIREIAAGTGRPTPVRTSANRRVHFGGAGRTRRSTTGQIWPRATGSTGRPWCRSSGRPCRSIPGIAAAVDRFGNLVITPRERVASMTARSTRCWWRSSPAPWPPSRRRSRPPSAGPPDRR